MVKVDFSLYLITDRSRLPAGRTLFQAVESALQGGTGAVQLREKDLTAAELYPIALEMRELTRRYGAKFLVNDRIDVALAVEADGVHLGGASLPPAVARRLLGPDRLMGVSTHSLGELEAAMAADADFVTFGPVYETPSKLAYGPPVGVAALAEACVRAAGMPVFALGGITPELLDELRTAGCRHLACIGAVLSAPDPASAAAVLVNF